MHDMVMRWLEEAESIGHTVVVVRDVLPSMPIEQMRTAIDMVKKRAKSAVIFLGSTPDVNKVTLLSGVTKDLVKQGVKAGDIVKEIAPIVDGGGGGKPQMAQAGGKNPANLAEALKKAAEVIKEKLADISRV